MEKSFVALAAECSVLRNWPAVTERLASAPSALLTLQHLTLHWNASATSVTSVRATIVTLCPRLLKLFLDLSHRISP